MYLQSCDSYCSCHQFTWLQERTLCSRLNIHDNLVQGRPLSNFWIKNAIHQGKKICKLEINAEVM